MVSQVFGAQGGPETLSSPRDFEQARLNLGAGRIFTRLCTQCASFLCPQIFHLSKACSKPQVCVVRDHPLRLVRRREARAYDWPEERMACGHSGQLDATLESSLMLASIEQPKAIQRVGLVSNDRLLK